jgi:hypothetical protein
MVSGGGGFRTGSSGVARARRYFAGSGYWPYSSSDYGYGPSGYAYGPEIEAANPGFFAVPSVPPPPAKPAEAQVLELQGERWVRLSPDGPPQVVGGSVQPETVANPAASRQAPAPKSAALPAAMLVFRDGHQEEIGQYTIMGTTINIRTDYWSSGSWTRKVQLAELDVPATLKLNQERGANFRLPSGPEEVMIGP